VHEHGSARSTNEKDSLLMGHPMTPEVYAEWMRRQGHRVYKTASSYWYDAGSRVLQAFPYHWLICPSQQEIQRLMLRHGMLSLRYSTPLQFPGGKISYHVGLRNPYHLEMLKAQSRNGIRRGLARCRIEQISFEKLATEGWALRQDTLERQNRRGTMTQSEWQRMCRGASDLPGFEAWAAVVGGELAAVMVVCQSNKVWQVPYAISQRKFLNEHVNNALFYSVSCNLLARAAVEGIFFNVQSLDAPRSVDEFKFRMGLIAQPVRQRVDFHPFLRPFATTTSQRLLAYLSQRDEGNTWTAKSAGMLRFHIEGKRPLAEQHWPDCLAERKQEILKSIGGNDGGS
jgi:hypothetical protein